VNVFSYAPLGTKFNQSNFTNQCSFTKFFTFAVIVVIEVKLAVCFFLFACKIFFALSFVKPGSAEIPVPPRRGPASQGERVEASNHINAVNGVTDLLEFCSFAGGAF